MPSPEETLLSDFVCQRITGDEFATKFWSDPKVEALFRQYQPEVYDKLLYLHISDESDVAVARNIVASFLEEHVDIDVRQEDLLARHSRAHGVEFPTAYVEALRTERTYQRRGTKSWTWTFPMTDHASLPWVRSYLGDDSSMPVELQYPWSVAMRDEWAVPANVIPFTDDPHVWFAFEYLPDTGEPRVVFGDSDGEADGSRCQVVVAKNFAEFWKKKLREKDDD